MLRDYKDILDKLGRPLWYDGNGVPRYTRFQPQHCGVYDRHVAFMRVGCQACDATWMVASEWGGTIDHLAVEPTMPRLGEADPWEAIGMFHYGDPPRHGFDDDDCQAGASMNSIPLEIVEFWSREFKEGMPYAWTRRPEYEGKLPKEDRQ